MSTAVRYLEHCVSTSKGHADPAIYHYLLQVSWCPPLPWDLAWLGLTCRAWWWWRMS